MAKKNRGRPPGSAKIVRAAETVGGTLGRVMAKVDAWTTQRQEIEGRGRQTLSDESPIPRRTAKPARGTTAARARKTRMMSAGARTSISEPQNPRGAKEKAGKTKRTRKAKKATRR